MASPLAVTREQILAFRRRAGHLGHRLDRSGGGLRQAARAGLQDSMPRAAVLSIHARMTDTPPDVLSDPSLIQVWGPRYNVYVIDEGDRAVFTLGRLPEGKRQRSRAVETADRLEALIEGGARDLSEAGRALGTHPNAIRYAAPTGRVLITWDGARRPTVRMVAPPRVEPAEARRELARRYLQVMGPSTPGAFGRWAGVTAGEARTTFEQLQPTLVAVGTPIGDAWILADDEADLRAGAGPDPEPVRLLPSGDVYYLLQDEERELLVPDPDRRDRLWTSRVWPGAVLAGGRLVGVWRRSGHRLTVEPWRTLDAGTRDAVEAEAASLPLPIDREPTVRWDA